MDSCIYERNEIFSWKLIDEDNQYDRVLRSEWKRASEKHLLFCKECGENVYLRAGVIREPHFYHARGSQCPNSTLESFESMRGKRLLVNMAERSFLNVGIRTKRQLPNGNYCTVFIEHKNGIVLDFHYNCLQNINYDERSQYYIDKNISFLHVFSGYYDGKARNVGATQKDTVQSIQGYCVFLNMCKNNNNLRIYYQMKEKHPKTRQYEIFEFEDHIGLFVLNDNGEFCYTANGLIPIKKMIEDFYTEKMNIYRSIRERMEKERLEQERQINEAAIIQKQKEEKEKQEAEQNRIKLEKEMQQMREEFEKRQEQRKKEEEQERQEREAKIRKYYKEQLATKLIRTNIDFQEQSEFTVYLKILDEKWILPLLLTRDWKTCSKKEDIRLSYIKKIEFWLFFADDNMKKILLNTAEKRINTLRFIDEWNKESYLKDFIIINRCNSCKDYSEFICINKVISYGDIFCKKLHACFMEGTGNTCTGVKKTCDYCKYKETQF